MPRITIDRQDDHTQQSGPSQNKEVTDTFLYNFYLLDEESPLAEISKIENCSDIDLMEHSTISTLCRIPYIRTTNDGALQRKTKNIDNDSNRSALQHSVTKPADPFELTLFSTVPRFSPKDLETEIQIIDLEPFDSSIALNSNIKLHEKDGAVPKETIKTKDDKTTENSQNKTESDSHSSVVHVRQAVKFNPKTSVAKETDFSLLQEHEEELLDTTASQLHKNTKRSKKS